MFILVLPPKKIPNASSVTSPLLLLVENLVWDLAAGAFPHHPYSQWRAWCSSWQADWNSALTIATHSSKPGAVLGGSIEASPITAASPPSTCSDNAFILRMINPPKPQLTRWFFMGWVLFTYSSCMLCDHTKPVLGKSMSNLILVTPRIICRVVTAQVNCLFQIFLQTWVCRSVHFLSVYSQSLDLAIHRWDHTFSICIWPVEFEWSLHLKKITALEGWFYGIIFSWGLSGP